MVKRCVLAIAVVMALACDPAVGVPVPLRMASTG